MKRKEEVSARRRYEHVWFSVELIWAVGSNDYTPSNAQQETRSLSWKYKWSLWQWSATDDDGELASSWLHASPTVLVTYIPVPAFTTAAPVSQPSMPSDVIQSSLTSSFHRPLDISNYIDNFEREINFNISNVIL